MGKGSRMGRHSADPRIMGVGGLDVNGLQRDGGKAPAPTRSSSYGDLIVKQHSSRFPPTPLPNTPSERWDQIRQEMGDSREQIFIGNNLRDTRTQSFINLQRPQQATTRQTPRMATV